MPSPPPKGRSSTVRWRSWVQIAQVVDADVEDARFDGAMGLTPCWKGPSKKLGEDREDVESHAPPGVRFKSRGLREVRFDEAGGDVDADADRAGERNQDLLAIRRRRTSSRSCAGVLENIRERGRARRRWSDRGLRSRSGRNGSNSPSSRATRSSAERGVRHRTRVSASEMESTPANLKIELFAVPPDVFHFERAVPGEDPGRESRSVRGDPSAASAEISP